MIPGPALRVIRAGTIVQCLPDRSGFYVALPVDGPGLPCPRCGAGAMGLCIVRQVYNAAGALEADYCCWACAPVVAAA